MNVVITITLPRSANALGIASDLVRRFGEELCLVRVEEDEVDEDEVDADMILTILQGAAQRMGDRPEARQLADLVRSLQAPPPAQASFVNHGVVPLDVVAEPDQAPPHGMRRPETTRYVRPNPTLKRSGNTPDRLKAIEAVIMNTSCPTCHAARGASCHSTRRRHGETYGTQHVHAARIDLMPWADDK